MNKPKAAFFTLGCKLNFAESSTLAREFSRRGYDIVRPEEQADVYVLNTCAVTAQAERKSRNAIRKIRRMAPDAVIVATGCYAQLRPQQLADIEGVDMVLGNAEKFQLPDYLAHYVPGKGPEIARQSFKTLTTYHGAHSTTGRTRSFLKIQDGCDHWCTYCTIPMARGRSRSQSIAELVREAREIAAAGYKEVVLTGVNVADFGKTSGESLADLMEALELVEIPRYRISSMEPELIHDRIIERIAHSSRFLPHFHVPLQSGSNIILKKMRRRYTRELFADRITQIRKHIPDAFIGVDVITGFPGETRAHFDETYRFLEGLPVSFLHVFSYSDRPGTQSEKMGEKVSGPEMKYRRTLLQELAAQKQQKFYQEQQGTVRQVLFEHQKHQDRMFGFTENYIKTAIPYDAENANQIIPVRLNRMLEDGTYTVEWMNEHAK